MASTLPPSRATRYGAASPAPPKIHRASYLVARELRCQPKTAAHRIAEVGQIAAAIVRAFRALGDQSALERFLRPIRQAEQGGPRELTDDLICDEREVDSREDVAQTRYLCDPSPVTADTWAKLLRKQAALATAVAEALEARAES